MIRGFFSHANFCLKLELIRKLSYKSTGQFQNSKHFVDTIAGQTDSEHSWPDCWTPVR